MLVELMPDEPEARRAARARCCSRTRGATARVDADGELVLLEDQDRSRWDDEAIDEGVALLDRALRRGRPGPYQVQAAIAACHATAPTAADTDWREIALLYGELTRMTGSPVVELNRAVAVAMAEGPDGARGRRRPRCVGCAGRVPVPARDPCRSVASARSVR